MGNAIRRTPCGERDAESVAARAWRLERRAESAAWRVRRGEPGAKSVSRKARRRENGVESATRRARRDSAARRAWICKSGAESVEL